MTDPWPAASRHARRTAGPLAVLAILLGLMATPVVRSAGAQASIPAGRRQMVGFVRDATGGPIEGATVDVHGQRSTTDRRGAFALLTAAVDTASIQVRRVGFEPVDALLSTRNGLWDTVVVQLDPAVTTLDEVTVTEAYATRAGGLRGFEERRRLKLGQYVTREEIVARGEQKLSEILRTKKGVQVVRGRVRFAAFSGSRSLQCQPNVFLDGARAPGMEVDEIMGQSVQAVELYPYLSTIPIEFQTIGQQTTPCGTIVIWTRIPNAKGR